MKILSGSILVVAMCLAALSPVSAQATDTVYVGTTHSATAAGLLEVVFPTAGFAYAGDWKRGFLPNAFRIGAAIGFSATADDIADDPCADDGWCAAFAIASLATTVWAIVGAVQTANDHNRRVRQERSSFVFEPSPVGGIAVGLRLRH